MSRPRTKKKRRNGTKRRPATFARRKTVLLEDGTIGYAMPERRFDDCFRSAIATVLQVPPHEIPDPQLFRRYTAGDDPETVAAESWAQLDRWLADRGLQFAFHDTVPAADRWIGVCPEPDTPAFREDDKRFRELLDQRANRAVRRLGIEDSLAASDRLREHCLVLSHDRVLFDPAVGLTAPPGMTYRTPRLADVGYGITFDNRQERP